MHEFRDRLDLLADEDLSIDKTSFQLAMKTKEAETDRVFQLFDLSNDGKIETLEFICALALISHANLKVVH
jgi:Ca2+-binding EF-hand superfamily protein